MNATYGGRATVIISGLQDPVDVRRHIEDIHPLGDSFKYTEVEELGQLVITLEQRGNTGAVGALRTIFSDLEEALDPCTNPGRVTIMAAHSEPIPGNWRG